MESINMTRLNENYKKMFSKILEKTCPSVASYLQLELLSDIKNLSNENFFQKFFPIDETDDKKYRLKINDIYYYFQVFINNKTKFEKIVALGYQRDGKILILNMLISRILEEIILMYGEDIKNNTYTINYPRDYENILNQAVQDFMYYIRLPFLNDLNYISSLPYESEQCIGSIVFVNEIGKKEENTIEFTDKISFNEKNYRIIRKILQIAGLDKYVVYDIRQAQIVGLVTKNCSLLASDNSFILEFRGHMHWIIYYKEVKVLEYVNGSYIIIESVSSYEEELKQFFNEDSERVYSALKLIENVSKQIHGTLVIISSNAIEEAKRLSSNNRGIMIKPINLTIHKDWIYAITSIDGALMIDENFNCYSIGTLLDGPSSEGDISRGARYNSALSYVKWRKERERVMAIIVSEDKMIKVII